MAVLAEVLSAMAFVLGWTVLLLLLAAGSALLVVMVITAIRPFFRWMR